MSNHARVFAFTQENTKSKPNEDWLHASPDKGVFAVADGVTLPRINGVYSEISSAHAATRFCATTTAVLAQRKDSLFTAFLLANLEIAALNCSHGITAKTVDYSHHDYLACVGIAGRLSKENPRRFEYGYIGDCGIFVYDEDYFPKFLSENPVDVLERFREGWGFQEKNEERIFWRGMLRNRPESPFMTQGVLTGELVALAYFKTGYVDLAHGDTLVLFSDGIYPFIFDRGFRELISTLVQDICDEKIKDNKLREYIKEAASDLRKRGVGNLDDDKTCIALRINGT